MSHPKPHYMKRYLRPLIGMTVTQIKETDGFTTIVFENGDVKYECDLSSDEEGNSPGYLFGLPRPR